MLTTYTQLPSCDTNSRQQQAPQIKITQLGYLLGHFRRRRELPRPGFFLRGCEASPKSLSLPKIDTWRGRGTDLGRRFWERRDTGVAKSVEVSAMPLRVQRRMVWGRYPQRAATITSLISVLSGTANGTFACRGSHDPQLTMVSIQVRRHGDLSPEVREHLELQKR